MSWGYSWSPYVSVAERRAKAKRHIAAKQKNGFKAQPVEIEGRKITHTFWGDSWCNHLESFSDFENRLPRGRTYVRNGSVCHLEINAGEVKSIVSGSDIYNITIKITKLPEDKWQSVKSRSTGQIGSLLDLLKGKLSKGVMAVVTDRNEGLFPLPSEIKMECSCPDWATMCKHVAATLYGVGARLDDQPELLFLLRGVDHRQLIAAETSTAALTSKGSKKGAKTIDDKDLGDIFGIEMVDILPTLETKAQSSVRTKSVKKQEPEPAPLREVRSKPSTNAIKQITQKTGMRAGAKANSVAGNNVNQSTSDPAAKTTPASRHSSTRGVAVGTKSKPAGSSVLTKVSPQQSLLSTASGKTMRDLREKFEMSQSQFAQLLGVSAASVSNWEKEHNLRSKALSAIAPVMKLSKRKAWEQLLQ